MLNLIFFLTWSVELCTDVGQISNYLRRNMKTLTIVTSLLISISLSWAGDSDRALFDNLNQQYASFDEGLNIKSEHYNKWWKCESYSSYGSYYEGELHQFFQVSKTETYINLKSDAHYFKIEENHNFGRVSFLRDNRGMVPATGLLWDPLYSGESCFAPAENSYYAFCGRTHRDGLIMFEQLSRPDKKLNDAHTKTGIQSVSLKDQRAVRYAVCAPTTLEAEHAPNCGLSGSIQERVFDCLKLPDSNPGENLHRVLQSDEGDVQVFVNTESRTLLTMPIKDQFGKINVTSLRKARSICRKFKKFNLSWYVPTRSEWSEKLIPQFAGLARHFRRIYELTYIWSYDPQRGAVQLRPLDDFPYVLGRFGGAVCAAKY